VQPDKHAIDELRLLMHYNTSVVANTIMRRVRTLLLVRPLPKLDARGLASLYWINCFLDVMTTPHFLRKSRVWRVSSSSEPAVGRSPYWRLMAGADEDDTVVTLLERIKGSERLLNLLQKTRL